MLIVWGKKIVRRRRGIARTFCPICRDLRCFNVEEKRLVPHLYYLPIGRSTFAVAELCCIECRVVLGASETVEHAAFRHSEPPSTLESEAAEARVRLEHRVRSGHVSPDERRDLINEPFIALHYFASERLVRGRYESWIMVFVVILCICSFGAAIGLFDVCSGGRPEPWSWTVLLVSLAVGLPTAFTLGYLMIHKRALTNTMYVTHFLARSLAPLRPTIAELEQALSDCRDLASSAGIHAQQLQTLMSRESR